MTEPFPVTCEQLREKLADRARKSVLQRVRRTDDVEGVDRPQVVIEDLQLGELAGPEFLIIQNVLSLVEHLEGYEHQAVDPDDPLETVEEQRGRLRACRNTAAWLRDRIDAGLRGVSV